jgi:hypothetical protein
MPPLNPLEARWGVLVRFLFKAFQAGNEASFFDALDRLGEARGNELHRDLRTLTVSLRRTLEEFQSNSRLESPAGKEMPDARLLLDQVAKVIAGQSVPAPVETSSSRGYGPAVPGVSNGTVGEQADVDALFDKKSM